MNFDQKRSNDTPTRERIAAAKSGLKDALLLKKSNHDTMFLKAADQVSDLNTKKWLIEVSDKLEYLVKHSEKKDYVVPIVNEILDSKPPDVLEALLGLQIKAFGRFENLVIEQ